MVSSTFGVLRKCAFKDVSSNDVLKSIRVVITAHSIKITGKYVASQDFDCLLNPESQPRMIDLQLPDIRTPPDPTAGQFSYGIYKLDGDVLKICASRLHGGSDTNDGADAKAQRPTDYWAELGSGKELLVLHRAGDAAPRPADEEAILGTWRIEEISDPAGLKPWVELSRNTNFAFSRHSFTTSRCLHRYTLDPIANPKRIDIEAYGGAGLGNGLRVLGIYELAGDRLRLGWRQVATSDSGYELLPPSTLAAAPGVTLVVLKRVQPVGYTPPVDVDSKSMAEGMPGFGPLIERTVNDCSDKPSDSAIDLDTGKLHSIPGELLSRVRKIGQPKNDEWDKFLRKASPPGPREVAEPKHKVSEPKDDAWESWQRAKGIDAVGCVVIAPMAVPKPLTAIKIGLLGQDTFATRLDNTFWNPITPPEVESLLARAKLEHHGQPDILTKHLQYGTVAREEFPLTFLFQTREGGKGILQIVGITEKPKAVKIRYKLVLKPVPTARAESTGPTPSAMATVPPATEPAADSKQAAPARAAPAAPH